MPGFSNRTGFGSLARLAAVLPFFVIGWREVFVPLAVVMHNQHGPTLAVAGLAIAASRVGGWLHAKGLFRRSPQEAAIAGGIALVLLGLAPEEGPVGLLLWFVFGATWPVLQAALSVVQPQVRLSLAVLTGMVVAGPLANGPGTWLIAGVCFLLARYAGSSQEKTPLGGPESSIALQPSSIRRDAFPFLFGFVSLMWIWLVPGRLVELGVALPWFGVIVAASWAARVAGAWAGHRLSTSAGQALGGLGMAAGVLVIAVAPTLWLLAAGMGLAGAAFGVLASHPAIERPEIGRLPGRSQALGEVLGPLCGVVIYLLGGSSVLFIAAALAGLALPIARRLEPPPTSIPD